MKSAVEVTAHDFQRIRTGRASPMILEAVKVDYYGTETPVNQVANVSIPDPRQILITPYDKNMLGPLEKAILKSDVGLVPNNDGQNIRLNLPPMTEDRRKELIKQVNHRAEEGCVAVRNVRRDAIHHLQTMEKNKEMSEDDMKGYEKRVQDLTDKYVAEVHEIQKRKDAELLEI
jgi:ribosome recycling factor